ncbi:MAG TPA: hypothetical protein DGR79_00745 [Clostridiales bacterium]|nr:hypothetical protein [Clostridiales bacterium]
MTPIRSLDLVREARRIRGLVAAVKNGQRAQGRAARLDGRDVVVLGFNWEDGSYEPLLVVVDPELAERLHDLRTVTGSVEPAVRPPAAVSQGATGPGRPTPPEARTETWFWDQLERMVRALNLMDDGWPCSCRYATLRLAEAEGVPADETEVVVFGPRTGSTVEPAFIVVDPSIRERLRDIRVLDDDGSEEDSPPSEGDSPEQGDGPCPTDRRDTLPRNDGYWQKQYEGRDKILWSHVIGPYDGWFRYLEFKDPTGEAAIVSRGRRNCMTSAVLFLYLAREGVPNHLVRATGRRELRVRALDMLPVEVLAAGEPVVVTFRPRRAAEGTPGLDRETAVAQGLLTDERAVEVEDLAVSAFEALTRAFEDIDLVLRAARFEFGRTRGWGLSRTVLGDEISFDTCRLSRADGGPLETEKDIVLAFARLLETARRKWGIDWQHQP